jgi:Cytochrome domain of cellobiose dehydrogenase
MTSVAGRTLAQDDEKMTMGSYVDAKTGINFTTWTAQPDSNGNGAFTFGMVLPEDATSKDATEYIGLLVCRLPALSQSNQLPNNSPFSNVKV